MPSKSVLLNFSTRLVVEATDPLVGIVAAQGRLLFFNQLSVGHFPSEPADGDARMKELVVHLRGLLEARALSLDDHDETIRLIIVLDMCQGEPGDGDRRRLFAAQKARAVRNLVRDIFAGEAALLRRLRYIFVFTDDVASVEGGIFRVAAARGIGASGWITSEMMQFNTTRDNFVKSLGADDDDRVEQCGTGIFESFMQKFGEHVALIRSFMDRVMCGTEFAERARLLISGIGTVASLRNIDFDSSLATIVGNLIGLCADDFRRDSLFFVVNVKTTPVNIWNVCDICLKSLIQLLATVSDDDYEKKLSKRLPSDPAPFYTVPLPDADAIDRGAVSELRRTVERTLSSIEKLSRKESSQVEYNYYELKANFPKAAYDEEYLSIRNKKMSQLDEALRPRLFFGMHDGDWDWYNAVCQSMDEMRIFEQQPLAPHIVEPHRITDADIEKSSRSTTYTDLPNEIDADTKLLREERSKAMRELADSNISRQNRIDDIKALENDVQKAMRHLGIVGRLVFFSSLAVALMLACFVLHFVDYPPFETVSTLVAALAAVGAVLASLLAVGLGLRRRVKQLFDTIRQQYAALKDDRDAYLVAYNERISSRNNMEVIQKRINEMQRKRDDFDAYNKRVELWKNHYTTMKTRLEDYESTLYGSDIYRNHEKELDDGANAEVIPENLMMTRAPMLPLGYVMSSSAYKTILKDMMNFDGVTCFVNQFRAQ